MAARTRPVSSSAIAFIMSSVTMRRKLRPVLQDSQIELRDDRPTHPHLQHQKAYDESKWTFARPVYQWIYSAHSVNCTVWFVDI